MRETDWVAAVWRRVPIEAAGGRKFQEPCGDSHIPSRSRIPALAKHYRFLVRSWCWEGRSREGEGGEAGREEEGGEIVAVQLELPSRSACSRALQGSGVSEMPAGRGRRSRRGAGPAEAPLT